MLVTVLPPASATARVVGDVVVQVADTMDDNARQAFKDRAQALLDNAVAMVQSQFQIPSS